jgi:hypothetical protein
VPIGKKLSNAALHEDECVIDMLKNWEVTLMLLKGKAKKGLLALGSIQQGR